MKRGSSAIQRLGLPAMTFAGVCSVTIGLASLASAQGNQPSVATPRASQGSGSQAAGEQGRPQAPIGHRQPRPQDVPSSASRDEGREFEAERELDKKLEICRGC
jgi:hypothetical protein